MQVYPNRGRADQQSSGQNKQARKQTSKQESRQENKQQSDKMSSTRRYHGNGGDKQSRARSTGNSTQPGLNIQRIPSVTVGSISRRRVTSPLSVATEASALPPSVHTKLTFQKPISQVFSEGDSKDIGFSNWEDLLAKGNHQQIDMAIAHGYTPEIYHVCPYPRTMTGELCDDTKARFCARDFKDYLMGHLSSWTYLSSCTMDQERCMKPINELGVILCIRGCPFAVINEMKLAAQCAVNVFSKRPSNAKAKWDKYKTYLTKYLDAVLNYVNTAIEKAGIDPVDKYREAWEYAVNAACDYNTRIATVHNFELEGYIAEMKGRGMSDIDIAKAVGRKYEMDFDLPPSRSQQRGYAPVSPDVDHHREEEAIKCVLGHLAGQTPPDGYTWESLIVITPEELVSAPHKTLLKIDVLADAYESDRIEFPALFNFEETEIMSEAFEELRKDVPVISRAARPLKLDKSHLNPIRTTFQYAFCPKIAEIAFGKGVLPPKQVPGNYSTQHYCDFQPKPESYKWFPLVGASNAPLRFCRTIQRRDLKEGEIVKHPAGRGKKPYTYEANDSLFESFHKDTKTYIMRTLAEYGHVSPYCLAKAIHKFGKSAHTSSIELYTAAFKLFEAKKIVQSHAVSGQAAIAAAAAGATSFTGFFEKKLSCHESHEDTIDFIRRNCSPDKPPMSVTYVDKDIAHVTKEESMKHKADFVFFDMPAYMSHYPPEPIVPPTSPIGSRAIAMEGFPDPFERFGTIGSWASELQAGLRNATSMLEANGYVACQLKGYFHDTPVESILHESMEHLRMQYVGMISYGHPDDDGLPLYIWKKVAHAAVSNPPI